MQKAKTIHTAQKCTGSSGIMPLGSKTKQKKTTNKERKREKTD
jgi:hypothetical protein